mgnify:CR=1 FL=1
MIKKTIIFLFTLFLFNQISYSIELKAPSVILQDYLSKEILYEKDADREIYPASMTKIMTSIIAFEMLKSGDLNLIVPFSSFVYLIGTEIDFSSDLLNGGFKFTNPQANRSCGCGTSFSV